MHPLRSTDHASSAPVGSPAAPARRRPLSDLGPILTSTRTWTLALVLVAGSITLAPSAANSAASGDGASASTAPADNPASSPMEALGELLGAMQGRQNPDRVPVDREQLRALLPDTLAGERRTRIKSGVNEIPGFSGGYAEADYGSGDRKLTVKLSDMGSIGAMAASFGQISEEETDNRLEKHWRADGNFHQKEADRERRSAEYTINFSSGLVLEVDGRGFTLEEVEAAIATIGPARIMALTEPKT